MQRNIIKLKKYGTVEIQVNKRNDENNIFLDKNQKQ